MPPERWERLGAATGIVFAVVAAVGLFIAPLPPDPGAPASEIAGYFTENRDRVLIQVWTLGLAGVFFLWFLGSLRSYLRAAEGEPGRLSAVVFGAGIAAFASFGTGTGLAGALAHSVAEQGGLEVTLAFERLAQLALAGTGFPLFVLLAAASLVSGRTKALPAWLGWLGWALAALALVSSLAVFFDEGALAPGGIVGVVLFAAFVVWFLAASLVMVGRVGRDSRPTRRD
ncbi:MAG: hypothetical protein ACRDJP_11255 [Actinomycetota bacterium]